MAAANRKNEGDGVNTYLTIDETVKIEPPNIVPPEMPDPGVWFEFPATEESVAALKAGRRVRLTHPSGYARDGVVASDPTEKNGMLLVTVSWRERA